MRLVLASCLVLLAGLCETFADRLQAGTASVAGVVLSADAEARPIRRALVTVRSASTQVLSSAVTDDEGRFVVEQLPPGRYTVAADKPGYLRSGYGARRVGQPGAIMSLSEGQHAADLLVSLVRGAAVSGVVRDPDGFPRQNARVFALRQLPSGRHGEELGAAYTNDRGEYRLYGLRPGGYLIAVMGADSEVDSVATAPTEAQIDAVLAALSRGEMPTTLRTDSSTSGAPSRPARPNLAPVFYPAAADVRQAAVLELAPSDDLRGIDVALQWVGTHAISGRILASTGVLPAVRVLVTPHGPVLPISLGRPRLRTQPTPDGSFEILNARPGRYTIRVSASNLGSIAAPDRVWGRAQVDVAHDDVSDVIVPLRPMLEVPGRFQFDPAPAASVPSPRVELLPIVDGERTFAWEVGDPRPEQRADGRSGHFRIVGVMPARYRVTVSSPGGWFVRSIEAGGRRLVDGVLDIPDDAVEVGDLVVTFTDRPTRLIGRLLAGDGVSVSDYFVVVFPVNAAGRDPGSPRVAASRPDTQGTFAFDLPAGEYFVAVLRDFIADDFDDPSFFDAVAPSAARVGVIEGQETRQDLRVMGG
jgi:hypothetical protein